MAKNRPTKLPTRDETRSCLCAFSEKRKADRAKMVAAVLALAKEIDVSAEVEISEGEFIAAPKMTLIRLEDSNRLGISIDFDGQTIHSDAYVLSWQLGASDAKRISDTFAGRDAVNPFHRKKATQVAYGFDDLCRMLKDGFGKSRTGVAWES